MRLALLFPGQGSQHVGMGEDLAASHPDAARVFEAADDALGFALSRLMWQGPLDELTRTENAQPAILVHSVAALTAVRSTLGTPSVAAGHSLGEFSAHVAAGSLEFLDALRLVRTRGELMRDAGEAREGTMAAVLGLDDDAVRAVCDDVDAGVCVPANHNAPGQVVISGDRPGVAQGIELARERGAKRVLELTVSGAFHSPLMASAEAGLRTAVERTRISDPSFPVVSNVTAEPASDSAEVADLLVRQLTAPVRWSESIRSMVAGGVDRFFEIGPGTVLCGLNRRNARGVPCTSVGTTDAVESLPAEV